MRSSIPPQCYARHPTLRVRCDRREHERGTSVERGRHRADLAEPGADRPQIVEWFS